MRRAKQLTASEDEPRLEIAQEDSLQVRLYMLCYRSEALVASTLEPSSFCKFMTDPENPPHLPRFLFADPLVDRDGGGHFATYLPSGKMKAGPSKLTKMVSRNPTVQASYRIANRGFRAGDRDTLPFFPFPQRRTLETDHAHWWRSAQDS
jgi:hypothetical protein